MNCLIEQVLHEWNIASPFKIPSCSFLTRAPENLKGMQMKSVFRGEPKN